MWLYLVVYLLGGLNQEPTETQVASVGKACNQFAFDFHSEIQTPFHNVFFSPYSICVAFSMVLLGAEGDTQKQLRNTFHYGKTDDVNPVFKKIISEYKNASSRKWTLNTANGIFPAKHFKLKEEYQHNIQHYYHARLQPLSFTNGKAEEIINSWVSKQTKNKIEDIFAPGALPQDTVLVMANAVYFKGFWKKKFDKPYARKSAFKVSPEKTVKVPMMSLFTEFPYYEDTQLNVQVLQVPYKGNRLSMLIILPVDDFGLPAVMRQLNADKLAMLMDIPQKEVRVHFPKFKMQTEYELKGPLQQLNLTDLFTARANFSGISNSELPLQISEARHNAFIEIDEEGTEAAAVSTMILGRSAFRERLLFICDHPFYFAIIDNIHKFVLFSGTVYDPTAM